MRSFLERFFFEIYIERAFGRLSLKREEKYFEKRREILKLRIEAL